MNVSFVMFSSKFFARTIDEILVSPTPPSIIVAGYILGGIVRAILVGFLVLAVSLFFSHLVVASYAILIAFLFLTALLFSLGGLINGVYAKSIDGINIIPTFVLTPLVYLGGVFYSTSTLSQTWQNITSYNPVFYIINGFRHGFLGFSDVPMATSFSVLIVLNIIFISIAWYLIKKGLGLKQ
jgi:ABC-2 type transport system permease protein